MKNLLKKFIQGLRENSLSDIKNGLIAMNITFILVCFIVFGSMFSIGMSGEEIDKQSQILNEKISLLDEDYFKKTRELTFEYALTVGFKEQNSVHYLSYDMPEHSVAVIVKK